MEKLWYCLDQWVGECYAEEEEASSAYGLSSRQSSAKGEGGINWLGECQRTGELRVKEATARLVRSGSLGIVRVSLFALAVVGLHAILVQLRVVSQAIHQIRIGEEGTSKADRIR